MRSNTRRCFSRPLFFFYVYTSECTSVCACVAGGLFLNRSKTIFRVSLSRSAHQRLTLTSTVLRFRGPRGTQEREHLEFLDSFISFSRDINRKSRAPIFFPLREILTRISTLEVELHLLAVDNNAQTYYDNNDDATSRSYFWRQTCESNNSPSALISRSS